MDKLKQSPEPSAHSSFERNELSRSDSAIPDTFDP